MEDLLTEIAQAGFPVAVAAYLLVRMEKQVRDLSNAILELSSQTRELRALVSRNHP